MPGARGAAGALRRQGTKGRRAALALASLLALAPGCRALGQGAQLYYEASAGVFTPNPAAIVPFYAGFGLGFLVGAPLLLVSWPLAALAGPRDDGSYGVASRLAPALAVGATVGDLLAAPFWPFGLPFEPDEVQATPAAPAPAPGDGLAGQPRDG